MGAVKGWLLTLISASILCAVADALMPAGPVKRVGKLVCGLVLLCAILSPAARPDLEGARNWLENYQAALEQREGELEQQVEIGMKGIIEIEYAAYIVDKAAELGINCTARVICRAEEGLYVPEEVRVSGATPGEDLDQLSRIIREDLGVSLERQTYFSEEALP